MDIKNLVTFIHVAELRSFTKAGDKLGYSQSTVSFQIRQLENELGVPLFERINRTVTLTEHGIRLLRSAYKINELLESFQEETKAETKVHGRVRLAIADSLSSEVIRRIFPELHRKYPDITLECISAGTQEMFRLLNQNEADIVYTLDNHIYDTNYVIQQESRIGVHFVCAAGNALAARDAIALTELVKQPFLLTEKGMSYRRMLELFIGEELAGRALVRPDVAEPASFETARPELALFDAQAEKLAAQRRLVKSATRPRFGLFAQGYYGYPGMDYFESMMSNDWSWNALVGFRMSWNFGAFYTKKNSLGKLRTAQRQLDVQRDVFLFNTRLQTVEESGDIARLRRALADDVRIVQLRRAVREAAESKLRNGVIDTNDLLRKITEEATAATARSAREIELVKTIYELKHTINR